MLRHLLKDAKNTWMQFGRLVEFSRHAVLTQSPMISYWGFRAPITPAIAGPRSTPSNISRKELALNILLCHLFVMFINVIQIASQGYCLCIKHIQRSWSLSQNSAAKKISENFLSISCFRWQEEHVQTGCLKCFLQQIQKLDGNKYPNTTKTVCVLNLLLGSLSNKNEILLSCQSMILIWYFNNFNTFIHLFKQHSYPVGISHSYNIIFIILVAEGL